MRDRINTTNTSNTSSQPLLHVLGVWRLGLLVRPLLLLGLLYVGLVGLLPQLLLLLLLAEDVADGK